MRRHLHPMLCATIHTSFPAKAALRQEKVPMVAYRVGVYGSALLIGLQVQGPRCGTHVTQCRLIAVQVAASHDSTAQILGL